jgi:hypothetical protein
MLPVIVMAFKHGCREPMVGGMGTQVGEIRELKEAFI